MTKAFLGALFTRGARTDEASANFSYHCINPFGGLRFQYIALDKSITISSWFKRLSFYMRSAVHDDDKMMSTIRLSFVLFI